MIIAAISDKRLTTLAVAIAMVWFGGAYAVEGTQASEAAYVPGRLLVKFKSDVDADASTDAARDAGVSEVRRLRAGASARTAGAARWRIMSSATTTTP
jgi:acid phosphatase class B